MVRVLMMEGGRGVIYVFMNKLCISKGAPHVVPSVCCCVIITIG